MVGSPLEYISATCLDHSPVPVPISRICWIVSGLDSGRADSSGEHPEAYRRRVPLVEIQIAFRHLVLNILHPPELSGSVSHFQLYP